MEKFTQFFKTSNVNKVLLLTIISLMAFSFSANAQFNVSVSSCNQGTTPPTATRPSGQYKVVYYIGITNDSYTDSVTNIQLTEDLINMIGGSCIDSFDYINVSTSNRNGNTFPQEWGGGSLNSSYTETNTSVGFFNSSAVSGNTLHPRQRINIGLCVVVDPVCAGNNVTFNNAVSVTSSSGNPSANVSISDFHITDANVAANIYVPVESPSINVDGTYDFTNTVILTNDSNTGGEAGTPATDVQFYKSMNTFSPTIPINTYVITQVSGPAVAINAGYNGTTDTELLAPGVTLNPGDEVVLNIAYNVGPTTDTGLTNYKYFNAINPSMTVGSADGDTESPLNDTYVEWTSAGSSHVDRYYVGSSATDVPSSYDQCSCSTARMSFPPMAVSLSLNKTVASDLPAASGISGNRDVTYQLTMGNDSASDVEIDNLVLTDDLATLCGGAANIVNVQLPQIATSSATTNPNINPGYNGISDINLFDNNSGVLEPGQQIVAQFTVEVTTPCTTPNTANFGGTDPLGSVQSSSSASIGINNPPDAQDDVASTNLNTALTLDVVGNNDTDPDSGDSLTISAINGNAITEGGAPVVLPDGTTVALVSGQLQITPPTGSTSPISFNYTIADGNGGFDTANVYVTVDNPCNAGTDAPRFN